MDETDSEKFVPPAKLLTQKTDDETIVSYLIQSDGNTVISPALREKLKRYEFCADELRKNPSWFFVAKRMAENYGLSENQAFRDIETTTRIYNTVARKQYIGRDFHISNLLSEVTKLYFRCLRNKDYRTAEKLLRDRADILDKFYGGYEAGLYLDLQIPTTIIGYYPELTNVDVPENWEDIIRRDMEIIKKKNNYEYTEFTEEIPEA